MKTIYYKNWLGEWVKDLSFTSQKQAEKRLSFVRKEKALNGQCEIFNK